MFKISVNSFCRITHYATASTKDSVYIIGGFTYDSTIGDRTSVIAEYRNDKWNIVGNLNQARHGHSAIKSGALTMVIGGSSTNSEP